jgi:hypothetical protein
MFGIEPQRPFRIAQDSRKCFLFEADEALSSSVTLGGGHYL